MAHIPTRFNAFDLTRDPETEEERVAKEKKAEGARRRANERNRPVVELGAAIHAQTGGASPEQSYKRAAAYYQYLQTNGIYYV